MQYIEDCYDCDEYWQGPDSGQAVRKAREHATETEHTIRVSGVYDGPSGGGIYVGDEGDEYHKVTDRAEKSRIIQSQKMKKQTEAMKERYPEQFK